MSDLLYPTGSLAFTLLPSSDIVNTANTATLATTANTANAANILYFSADLVFFLKF